MKTITITAEVTGTVWKIITNVGDAVGEGQDLVILESMKMEIPHATWDSGTVREILIKEGDPVKDGQDLLIIELS